jgi:2-polyprenyl-3-methyl-5-hydroxy-6-metoxy-1,4-benzoquinol methylase
MRNLLSEFKLFDIDLYKLRSRNFHADMIKDREKILAEFKDCLCAESDFFCPLCFGVDKKFYINWREYALYECSQCGAVSPNLDQAHLAKRQLHSTEIIRTDLEREILATYDYRKETFAKERVKYLTDILPSFGEPDERVLDVGCGPGYFLDYLKDIGIAARGLELNPYCVEFSQRRGLNVATDNLEDEPDGFYSLITMFDVLEHLDAPVRLISSASKCLRSGGHLLAYTPNIHSLSTWLMGGEHNMLAPFNHLCFYDTRSLAWLAQRTGFEVIRCDYYGLDVMDFLAMKESQDGTPYFGELRKMVAPLQAVLDSQGLSNCMRVLFRKV